MYKSLKILHLVGLSLFLGSVFGHVVASAVGGEIGGAEFLFARKIISVATWALTLPGLALSICTGVALAALSPARRPWMYAHAGFAIAIALIAAFVLVPAGMEALRGVDLSGSGPTLADVEAALMRERIAGAVNILLALCVVAIGVIKPVMNRRSRRAEPLSASAAKS
jgi:hypothetical protein